jgi:hypothetical protein
MAEGFVQHAKEFFLHSEVDKDLLDIIKQGNIMRFLQKTGNTDF